MNAAAALSSYALHATWQVPLLAGAAWCAVCVGRAGARTANAVWTGTLLLCVLLPLLATLQAWSAARDAGRERLVAITFHPAADADGLPALHRDPAWLRILHRHATLRGGLRPFALSIPSRWERSVATGYVLVCGAAALSLLLAWRRMRLLIARSQPCTLSRILSAAEQHNPQCCIPELRVSEELPGPCVAGVLRPVLLLPHSTDAMTEEELIAVLAHEFAHVRRHDPAAHLLCSLLMVPVSFHPAAWWVERRIRQTREMACDAAAARNMHSGAAYAHALLRVAGRAQVATAGYEIFGNGLFGAGLGLWSKQRNLEERMQMLMKPQQPATRAGRAARMATCVAVGTAGVLAAAMVQVRPTLAAEQAAKSSVDPAATTTVAQGVGHTDARPESGATASVPSSDVRVDLTLPVQVELSMPQVDLSALQAELEPLRGQLNSPEWKARMEAQAKLTAQMQAQLNSPEWKAEMQRVHELAARSAAQFSSPAWKAEMQRVQAAAAKAAAQVNTPEFRSQIEAASRLDDAKLKSMLEDARKQQQQAIEQMRSSLAQLQTEKAQLQTEEAQLVARATLPQGDFAGAAAEPLKVKSSVMAGQIVQKVQPVYPPEAKEKKIQGEVLLHAIISEEGKVEQLTVVHSPDGLLSKSALDAVKQWTYKPYLLNGTPVAVDTTITVNYSFGE